jgi:hypothetical protein
MPTADSTTTTDTTTTTTSTTDTSFFTTVKDTVMGWFGNEMVKLAAAGVGGFVAGYLVRTVQGYFSK